MTTYRFLANDLIEIFRQTNDDSEIGLVQVIFWVNVICNRLKMQHIKKQPTGTHLTTFNSVIVSNEPVTNKKYFDLPKSVYDLKHDKGIDYIAYDTIAECCSGPAFVGVVFGRTTSNTAKRLYKNPYEKPSAKNPYFYRVGERVYLLGLECVNSPQLEIALYTSIDTAIDVCSLDDAIPLSDELISVLKYEVLNLGRFALIVPNERINEGADQTTQAIQEEKIDIPLIRQPEGVPAEQQTT